MTPITCSCSKCRAMCEHSTCLPTAAEARELIRRGYGPRLATYRFWPDARFVGPAPAGREGARDIPSTTARCTFFDGQHCQLHALGLKPLEGRLAHHDRDWRVVRLHVTDKWKGRVFDSVHAALHRSAPEPQPEGMAP